MRYFIDRKAAIDILEVAINDGWEFDYARAKMLELTTQPEIIYCKYCVHVDSDAPGVFVCRREGMGLKPYHICRYDYCSCAERKPDEGEEYDPRPDIYYLAEKIGIHRLYALVTQLRGEP